MKKYITAGNSIRFMGVLFGCVAFMAFTVMCLALIYDPAAAPMSLFFFGVLWFGAVKCFTLASDIDYAELDRQWWEARNNG